MKRYQLVLRLGTEAIRLLKESSIYASGSEYWVSYPEIAKAQLWAVGRTYLIHADVLEISIRASANNQAVERCNLMFGGNPDVALEDESVLASMEQQLPELARELANAYSQALNRMIEVICLTDRTVVFPHCEDTVQAATDAIENDPSDLCGRLALLNPEQMQVFMAIVQVSASLLEDTYSLKTHRIEPSYAINSRSLVSRLLWVFLKRAHPKVVARQYPETLADQEKISATLESAALTIEEALSAVLSA